MYKFKLQAMSIGFFLNPFWWRLGFMGVGDHWVIDIGPLNIQICNGYVFEGMAYPPRGEQS